MGFRDVRAARSDAELANVLRHCEQDDGGASGVWVLPEDGAALLPDSAITNRGLPDYYPPYVTQRHRRRLRRPASRGIRRGICAAPSR